MATRKLVSKDGTVIGTVAFPNHWLYWLSNRQAVRFMVPQPMIARYGDAGMAHCDLSVAAGMLCDWQTKIGEAAVLLVNIDLETFETVPGCSFAPSAAYLRSIVG